MTFRLRATLLVLASLAGACARAKAGTDSARSPAAGPHEEVVRYCSGKDAAAATASPGPGCDANGQPLARQLYEAGVRIGVGQGTQRIHGMGIRAAAEQLEVAADVRAKIAEKTRKADDQAAADADGEMTRVSEKLAAGSCLPAAAARAIVERGARCGMAAYDTDEYQTEYARAFGIVCEHQLSQEECLRRAESEYARMPRSPEGDGGAY
jgi:hypothetical protein